MSARDHREVGRQLDLFHFQDEAPGMVFWHPRGLVLLRELEAAVRRMLARGGYEEVRTPQVLRRPIWERSGHWAHYREQMFLLEDGEARAQALKPVSCPLHLEIAARRSLSYRSLPLRLAELGLVHRREPSGALAGLLRLQQFTQDDGHVLCSEGQVVEEAARFLEAALALYRHVGSEAPSVSLSVRPPARLGDDGRWDRAEALLEAAARRAGLEIRRQEGGAFYGPKLELALRGVDGRLWQCGTVQADPFLPERFGVDYAEASGERRAPWMLHRAALGSLERFLGLLLERGPALPAWLAPEQVVVAPVAEPQLEPAHRFGAALQGAGLRARVDGRGLSLSRRALEARQLGVPYFAVIGRREAAEQGVALSAGGEARVLGVEGAVRALCGALAPPDLGGRPFSLVALPRA